MNFFEFILSDWVALISCRGITDDWFENKDNSEVVEFIEFDEKYFHQKSFQR